MAVSFTKYQDDITRAWREVVDSAREQKWALFTYEGTTNVIRLMATGSGGLDELVEELNCSLIQYAFCRVIDNSLGLNKLVLINWQGDSAPLSRKGLCASHVGDVANYFKGCTQTITIRNDDEATKEHLMEQILKTSASKLGLSMQNHKQPSSNTTTTTSTTSTSSNSITTTANSINNGTSPNVSTRDNPNDSNSVDTSANSSVSSASSVYKKVELGTDIAASRKSFWQRQEEEEKERLAEEKRRAAEKQAQFEKERKQREALEAKKLAETIEKRDKLIEATKKADKQSLAASRPGPPSSATAGAGDSPDDDGRVGRRSELIRLERNQETQSLISKGLIKNKRAIFEQAQQQQQQSQQPTTLSRRASGAMITKRVNAFKSLDCGPTTSPNSNTNDGSSSGSAACVNKLTESFNKQVGLNGADSAEASSKATSPSSSPAVVAAAAATATSTAPATVVPTNAVRREIEPVQLTRESEDLPSAGSMVTAGLAEDRSAENTITSSSSPPPPATTPTKQVQANGLDRAAGPDDNGNVDSGAPKKSSPMFESPSSAVARSATPTDVISNEELILNGKNSSIKAMALYDYQAADNTEISFDPDDEIGHIQKVDPGWWHGQVISGRFKGQIGLFPANYVQEL